MAQNLTPLSIIIVNFNAGECLTDCVQSIFTTESNVEVIISDNGSSDTSLLQLKATFANESRLRILENQQNLGFSAGNNRAIPFTKGDYILFLNPDCLIKSGTLQRVREVMEQNPNAAMAGCLNRARDGSIQSTSVRAIPTPWNSLVRVLHLQRLFPRHPKFLGLDLGKHALPQQICAVEGISGAFMYVRRRALEEVGLLDEAYFLYCEDADWMLRFQQAGWKILFVPNAEITHLKGVCSKKRPLRVIWYKHKGMMYFYRKFFRKRYSSVTMLGVYAAIWARFILLCISQLIIFVLYYARLPFVLRRSRSDRLDA